MKLVSTFDLASLFSVLEEGIRSLGIPSYYVCLYDRPVTYSFPDPLPETARLVFALNPQINLKDKDGKRFDSSGLLPDYLVDRGSRFDRVVIPLVFGEKQLGYTVAGIGPVTSNFYSVIADQLACALMGSLLLAEQKKTESFLETTLENLQTKAGVVAKNSQAITDRVSAVSTATEEIAANIRQISRETEEVMSAVHNATGRVNSTVGIIQALREQSDRISQITGLINDIAEKTNILSLNANIQAARAGDAGRGFKVVADEIKKLSRVTVDSTAEIRSIVSVIRSSGQETYDAVSGIIDIIGRISDLSTHIREAISQQSIATNEVADSLTETATGSRTIFEAIKEVAVAEDGGESDTAGNTISEQLRRFTHTS